MNRRVLVIGGLGLVIIAIGLVFAVRGGRGGGQQAQKKAEEKADQRVIVALVDIKANDAIKPEMLDANKLVTASEKAEKFAGAITDPEKLVGGVALVAIPKDSPVKPEQIKAPPESVSQKVTPNYVAVTVAAPEKPSLYDLKFLKPDDRVDVMGVTFDDKGNWTTSTPLAADVRVLAVDAVWDKFKEEMRRKRVEAEIAQLTAERDEKAKAPGATADSTKALEEAIKAKREELDPKIENPSVTVEVTQAIAQLLALWRTSPRTTLKVALHRQRDSQDAIFAVETLAAPVPTLGTTTAMPPMGALNLAAAGGTMPTVLSMDDVVPLIQRDPKQYADMLEIQKTIASTRTETELRKTQIELERTRNQVEARNWLRYGQASPPVSATGSVPPLVVPRVGGYAESAKPAAEKPKPQPPSRYSAPIEVYRGSQVSVVGS